MGTEKRPIEDLAQTDRKINQKEVWQDVIRVPAVLVVLVTVVGCSGDSGVDDEGWRCLTTVLTTSCELEPISCGGGGHSCSFWSQNNDPIQIRHMKSLFF